MAVALETLGTATHDFSVQSCDFPITIGSQSNRAVILVVVFDVKTVSGVAAAWDPGGVNQSMTLIQSVSTAGANGRSEIWGLVNPGAATSSIRITWTGATDIAGQSGLFSGVDQTGGTTSFPNSTTTTGNTANPSLAITSAVGNYTVVQIADASTAVTAGSQTMFCNDYPLTNSAGWATSAAGASPSVTHGFTVTASEWAIAGTDILAAGGGGGAAGFMWI